MVGMAQEPVTRRRRIRHILEQIREPYTQYRESGQSAQTFAQQHGIGLSTLHHWRRRLKVKPARRRRRPKWVEVTGSIPATGLGQAYEIRLPDGICLMAPASVTGASAVDLVRSLREL